LILGVSATEARAQSVVFGGGQTTVNAGTLNEPAAVAVDAAGDVFIADSDDNRVVEVPAGGGAPVTIVTTPFVLSNPLGVAVDSSGNLFIADYNNSRVVKVPPAGGGSPTTVGNVSQPNALAVDGSGDLFIVQPVQGDVVEVTPSGSQTTIVGGLAYPSGVAVDGLGDLFIADTGAFAVIEVAPGGAQTTLVSGSELPGVAVDKLGDVFIVGYGPSPLLELPAGGGAPIALGVGIYGPLGVAVDGSGNVFVADTLNNRVVEVQPTAVNFGPANICPAAQSTPAPCSQSETLVYNGPAYGVVTVGTVSALTMGVHAVLNGPLRLSAPIRRVA
jgi:sugar lactone lactonase YvrE